MKKNRSYTLREEVIHSIVHGLGILVGVAGLPILVILAAFYGNVWSVVSCSIFGASVILMYSASTVYHAIPFERAKKILKKFDHISIYYLIAGTYTPFLLVNLRAISPVTAWTVFGIIWGLSLLGTVLKLISPPNGTKLWSVGLYLLMGWAIVFISKTLFQMLPTISLAFLVLGGVFYTLGVFFYIWKSKPYTHVIWHAFVLLGTLMHFFAILFGCVFLG